jgi:hypothetical protein
MPYISADVFHGLKLLVTLFSGELSITSGGSEPDEAEVPLEDEPPELEEPDEHAAMPTTRKPAAAIAASRLPLMILVVNIDYPLGC